MPRRILTAALAVSLLLATVPADGVAALCGWKDGVHTSCCCKSHGMEQGKPGASATDACCCDLSDEAAGKISSFLSPRPSKPLAPDLVAALGAPATLAAALADGAQHSVRWPPGARPRLSHLPIYLEIESLRI